ncbi:hypothetical protein LUZ60_002056 [Juncus effusus]|nr:hypothetical protein LUZ60_002056 [Juncus effusus]
MKLNTPSLSSLFLLSLLSFSLAADTTTNPLQEKCAQEFTQLTTCLDYVSAKVADPGTACCTAVSGIREQDPACLCYIIQQAHSGSSDLTSLGVRFDRLLSLPQGCKLANTSIADCPKLLKIPPSSPDYALFTNPTKAAGKSSNSTTPNSTSSPLTSSTTTTTTGTTGTTNGTGTKYLHKTATLVMSFVCVIFFSFY